MTMTQYHEGQEVEVYRATGTGYEMSEAAAKVQLPVMVDPDTVARLLAFLVLVGLLTFARVSELTQPPISCERHHGDFSNDFSPPDFDVNSVDCWVSFKNSPTIRFWSTAPYLGIRWPQRVL